MCVRVRVRARVCVCVCVCVCVSGAVRTPVGIAHVAHDGRRAAAVKAATSIPTRSAAPRKAVEESAGRHTPGGEPPSATDRAPPATAAALKAVNVAAPSAGDLPSSSANIAVKVSRSSDFGARCRPPPG